MASGSQSPIMLQDPVKKKATELVVVVVAAAAVVKSLREGEVLDWPIF